MVRLILIEMAALKSKDDQVDTLTNWIAIVFISMSIGMNFVF